MPKRTDIKRVLIIGSGPIVIGQACKALRAEGLEVILVNSNPATIMTDPEMADRTYIEPLTVEVLDAIIARDYQQVQGFALLTALAFVGINLLVDLTYTFRDPRIRYA